MKNSNELVPEEAKEDIEEFKVIYPQNENLKNENPID